MKQGKILFYGSDWCGDCRRARKWLDDHDIAYEYHDTEIEDDAIELVREVNDGLQSIPTIIFPDKSILVEPTNEELKQKFSSIDV